MEQTTYSLTLLAALSHRGRSVLRAMIANGELLATRGASGRRDWIVRHSDAVAAGLVLPTDDQYRQSQNADAGDMRIDLALRCLLEDALQPIEDKLIAIEGLHADLSRRLDAITTAARAPSPSTERISVTARRWLDVWRKMRHQ